MSSKSTYVLECIFPNYSLTKCIIRRDIFSLFWTMQQTVNHPYTGFRKISCGVMLPRVFHYVHSNILQNYVQSFLPFICYLEILTNCNFNSYSSSRELKLLYQKMVPSALNSDSALKNILFCKRKHRKQFTNDNVYECYLRSYFYITTLQIIL